MSVVTDYQELGPCTRRMTIEVPAPAVDAERGRVVKDLARKVQLPGFRKGKVPAKVVEKRFANEIQQELGERLIPRYLKQAEAEKGLVPLLGPQVKELSAEPGEPMTFVAELEVRPQLEIGELDDIELPEPSEEPSEEEVETALTDLRRSRADWIATERPAATGDRVSGLVVSLADEKGEDAAEEEGEVAEPVADADADAVATEAADKPQRYRVEIGGEGVDERISLALTGATAGGHVKIAEIPGHDAPGPFRLEVEAVEERDLPEPDDAFAAQVGEFESWADLREAIEFQLRLSKQQDRRMQRETALLDELRKRHPLQLPERVVERELERMLHEYADRLMSQGIDIERAGIPWERIHKDLRPRAEARVHARLLLDAVADAREVRVDERELERLLGRMAQREKTSSQSLRQHFSQTGQLDDIRAELRRERVIRSLLGEDEPAAGADGTKGAADEGPVPASDPSEEKPAESSGS